MSSVIVAAATPWGLGALAVVRLSGVDLAAVVAGVVAPFRPGPWRPGRARRVWLQDREGVFDDAVAVWGEAPRTYTGEDSLEVSCHGNPLIVERLLAACVSAGARIARPGEFTRRAVVNGKMDLLRAEGVQQVGRARTPAGLRVGRAGLDGSVGRFVEEVRAQLLQLTAELEARLDYPGDELALVEDHALMETLATLTGRCRGLAQTYQAGRRLIHGARVALVGPVNAGKSSLFNALLGRTRALVHAQPGTTRDVLEVQVRMGPLEVTLLDTAGERETEDPIEAAGLALARALIEDADLLVIVLRAKEQPLTPEEQTILQRTRERPRLVVYNGVDRGHGGCPEGALATSAHTQEGLQELERQVVRALISEETQAESLLIASARQRDLLLRLAALSEEACTALPLAGVAVAAELLTEALAALDELTGVDTREDVLDALFARFCIGK